MRDIICVIFLISYFLKLFFIRKTVLHDKSIINLLPECWPILMFSGVSGVLTENTGIVLSAALSFFISLFLLSMLMYNKQFGNLVSINDLNKIGMLPAVKKSIAALVKPVYLLLFCDLPVSVLLFLHKKSFQINIPLLCNEFYILLIISAVFLLIAGYRMSIKYKEYSGINGAKAMGIFNYEVFGAMNLLSKKEETVLPLKIDIKSELKRIKDSKEVSYSCSAEGMNLLVIQVECLQNFVLGTSVSGQQITPNINRLLHESLYFPRIFSQIGPGNTSDAEFMLNTSLYPFESAVISRDFSDREFPSLPRLLRNSGYESLTLHTNTITFWNRDKLYPSLGFDKAYDISFFGNEDIIGLGPSDEVLYKKTARLLQEMVRQNRKFYSSIITLTSHHPFMLPPDRKKIILPDAVERSFAGKYISSINYADYALGQFIEYLKCNSLLDNTMLVIFGDHYGLRCNSLDKADCDILESILDRQYDIIDTFNIPLLIRLPGNKVPRTIYKSGGQIDIMPTICNLLGLSADENILFGQDLLGYDKSLIGIRHMLPAGSFINDDIFYVHDCGGLTLDYREPVTQKSFPEESAIVEYMELSDQYVKSLPKMALYE